MSTTKPYPSILQGFGIIAIFLGYTLLARLLISGPVDDKINLLTSFIIYSLFLITLHRNSRRRIGELARVFRTVPLYITFSTIFAWLSLFLLLSIVAYLFPSMEKAMYEAETYTNDNSFVLIRAVLIAPFFEELIFRGIILKGFLERYKPLYAILWSAILFGLIHFDVAQGINGFVMGLLLGWVFYKTCSIIPGIFLHAINNFLATYNFSDGNNMSGNNETLRELLSPLQYSAIYVVVMAMFVGCIYLINRFNRARFS